MKLEIRQVHVAKVAFVHNLVKFTTSVYVRHLLAVFISLVAINGSKLDLTANGITQWV